MRLGLLVVIAIGSGCATYSERLADVRRNADVGAYPAALDELNDIIGVGSVEELPDRWKGDRALAVLERAVLLQAEGEFALSARDLSGAEAELEVLDLKTDAVGQIGNYVYSDASEDYRASPTERLALNALNMLNYLAMRDLSGAAVEARRFTEIRDYLASLGLERSGIFGAYLAGCVFEHLGEGDRALRYYEEALAGGTLESLAAPITRLARRHPYRGPRIEALLARAAPNPDSASSPAPRDASTDARPAEAEGEVLVVLARGRVPYKVPERLPIGAAVGLGGSWITGNPAILERSLLKVVVYPELVNSGRPTPPASVQVDGQSMRVEDLGNLGGAIRQEYQLIKPRIVGAAVTRLITRAAAAEGARFAGREAGGSAGQIIGLLAALVTEGALVALDKPDTRSWTLLPERISVSRAALRAGPHEVAIEIPGTMPTRTVPVRIEPGGLAVIVVTVPR